MAHNDVPVKTGKSANIFSRSGKQKVDPTPTGARQDLADMAVHSHAANRKMPQKRNNKIKK